MSVKIITKVLLSTKSIISKIMQLKTSNAFSTTQLISLSNVEKKTAEFLYIVFKVSQDQQLLSCLTSFSNKDLTINKLTHYCNPSERSLIPTFPLWLSWCGSTNDFTCPLTLSPSIQESLLFVRTKLKIQHELLPNWWWNTSLLKRCQNQWILEVCILFKHMISFEFLLGVNVEDWTDRNTLNMHENT